MVKDEQEQSAATPETAYVLGVLYDVLRTDPPEELRERVEDAADLLSGWCSNQAALMVVRRYPEA